MKSKLIKLLIAGMLVLGCAVSSYAVPTLWISDGVDPAVVVVGVAGSGSVTYTAPLGALGTWTVVIANGLTPPIIGSTVQPSMHLDTLTASSTAAGTLTVLFSEVGFGPTAGGATVQVGGVAAAGGQISAWTYKDPGNNSVAAGLPLPGTVVLLTALGPFGPGSFSGSAAAAIAQGANYSLIEEVTITHNGAGSSSVNLDLTVPDGGTTVLLLGAALSALGLIKRRLG